MAEGFFLLIEPDGTLVPVRVPFTEDGGHLSTLQSLVQGWIEVAPSKANVDIYVNEEGWIINLEPNIFGPFLTGTHVAGPMAITAGLDESGYTVPFVTEDAARVLEGAQYVPAHTVADVEASRAAGNYWHPEGV